MLIVIIILGISASQMAVNEERGARNDRDHQIAFQAAEAALKDAEYEILNPSSPPCAAPGQTKRGRGRAGTFTCFNSVNAVGFTATPLSACSLPPNAGLCDYDATSPAWRKPLTDPAHIDFVADAKGSGAMGTVAYGQYTGRVYRSQATPGLAPLLNQPLSRYPPRYIIERVRRNTSVDTLTGAGEGSDSSDGAYMFRVTAMGFGARENTQVV
ncbi:MAG: pilus assembly PilX family protein, partial [Burkholderiaceae bacterium]